MSFSDHRSALKAIRRAMENTLDKKGYKDVLSGIQNNLAGLGDTYAEHGYGKLSTTVLSIKNKCEMIRKRIDSGKYTTITEIKEQFGKLENDLLKCAPKDMDNTHQKAGIKDQSSVFGKLEEKKVKLEVETGKMFALQRAPLLLLFKGKINSIQSQFLKTIHAKSYQGTNGVVVPSIPILVLDKNQVAPSMYNAKVKAILRALKQPNLAVFTDRPVIRNNCVAFMVFEPKIAEFMSVGIFDQCLSVQLWVE